MSSSQAGPTRKLHVHSQCVSLTILWLTRPIIAQCAETWTDLILSCGLMLDVENGRVVVQVGLFNFGDAV